MATLEGQFIIFFTTVVIGGAIAFLYDILRIIRKLIPHSGVFIQIEDILYWLFVTFVVFIIMLRKNYGEIRAFSIAGAFLGMMIYYAAASHFVLKMAGFIIETIKKIILTLFHIISLPIKILLTILNYPYNILKNMLLTFWSFFRKIMKTGSHITKRKSKKLLREIKIITKKV